MFFGGGGGGKGGGGEDGRGEDGRAGWFCGFGNLADQAEWSDRAELTELSDRADLSELSDRAELSGVSGVSGARFSARFCHTRWRTPKAITTRPMSAINWPPADRYAAVFSA